MSIAFTNQGQEILSSNHKYNSGITVEGLKLGNRVDQHP